MSPALFTNQDAAIVELTDKLAKVTAERDRARDTAVALEQEVARREGHDREVAATALRDFANKWAAWIVRGAPQIRGGAAYRANAEADRIARGGAA